MFPCQPAMLVNSFVNSCKYNLICLYTGIPQDAQITTVWNVSERQPIQVGCTHGVLIASANYRLMALTCRVSQSVFPGSLSSVVTELVCSSSELEFLTNGRSCDSQSIVHWSQLIRSIFSRVNSKSAMLVVLHLITRPGILLASRVLCC